MSLPGSGLQLLVLLAFVIPGSVYQAVKTRLQGPRPDEDAGDRVLRAVALSAGFASAYAIAFGPWIVDLAETPPTAAGGPSGLLARPRQAGLAALALLFVVPAVLALVDHWRATTRASLHTTYDPTPRAWDYVFRGRDRCFVRIRTRDGIWIGGWYDTRSFASSYPHPDDIYIEKAYRMHGDGTFGEATERSQGIYVKCDNVEVIEFLGGSDEQTQV